MTPVDDAPARTPEELFARFRDEGDVEAFGELFDRVSPVLFRMALSLAPDAPSAEDALQETFLAAMAAAGHFDPSRPVTPWLVGILRLKVHEVRRRTTRSVDPARLPPPLFPDDPSGAAEGAEEVERVRKALDALPEPYRSVAVLRWRYGLEPAEIADARNEPPGTVRSILHRAKERLRESLKSLPALLLAGPSPRGLGAVRAAVLKKAAATAAAAAGTAGASAIAATATWGGLIMGKKVVAGVALLALLVTSAIGWHGSPRSAPPPRILDSADRVPPRIVPSDPLDPPARAETPDDGILPGPVDLGECDRDRDLFGTVLDEDGVPVEGAALASFLDPRRTDPWLRAEPDSLAVPGPTSRTAKDGTFRLRLERGAVVDLRVSAPGFADAVVPLCLAGERLTVTLRRGASLVVRTVDSERKPVSGVRIHLTRSPDGDRPVLDRAADTGVDGTATFAGLTPGIVSLRFDHPLLARPDTSFSAVPRSGTRALEVVLPEGSTVYGRVLESETGVPVPGARISWGVFGSSAVLTDENGRFAFPGYRGGGIDFLIAEKDGFAMAQCRVIPWNSVDFALSRGDRAEGTVVGPDGAGLEGALVILAGAGQADPRTRRREYDRLRSTPTGEEGRFAFPDLRRDLSHVLIVQAPGFARAYREFGPASWGPGTVDLGTIVLSPGFSLEGRLVDEDDHPLAARSVRLEGPLRDDGLDIGRLREGRTDDLGRFRFRDLAPGRYRVTDGTVGRGVPAASVETTIAAGEDTTGVVLRISSSGEFRVRVLDPGGEPVPGIPVSLRSENGALFDARSDADGLAVFATLPEGTFVAQAGVCAGSGLPWSVSERSPPIAPGGEEVVLRLTATSRISGFVRDAAGQPVPRLEVRATDPERTVLFVAFSDGEGRFSFDVPTGMVLNLRVEGGRLEVAGDISTRRPSDYRGEVKGVRAPSEEVVVRVTGFRDRSLTVQVLDLKGTPVSGIRVVAWSVSPAPNGVTDESGRVRFFDLPPEEITVGFLPSGSAEGTVIPLPIKVVPIHQEITAVLRKGIPFPGRVLGPDDRPVAGAEVGASAADGTLCRGRTNGDGEFLLSVPEGVRIESVSAFGPDEGDIPLVAEVREVDPEAGPITLRLAPRKP